VAALPYCDPCCRCVTEFAALPWQDEHSDSNDEELALDLEDDEEELLKQSEKMKRQM
jgi:hypothetical protein